MRIGVVAVSMPLLPWLFLLACFGRGSGDFDPFWGHGDCHSLGFAPRILGIWESQEDFTFGENGERRLDEVVESRKEIGERERRPLECGA